MTDVIQAIVLIRITNPQSNGPDCRSGALEHAQDRLDLLGGMFGAKRAAQQRHTRGRCRWASKVHVKPFV